MPCDVSKTIAITGASGFIGSFLKNYFRQSGYTAISLQRKKNENEQHLRPFDLIQPETISPALFEGVDVLIHCAFVKKQKNQGKTDSNLVGTRALLAAAKQAGVKKFIFFSSVSAHEQALSYYAKSKLEVETLFQGEGTVVLKCGLVIGKGGLFEQMLSYSLARKIIPLMNGGRQPVQFISIDSVALSLRRIIEADMNGSYVLAQPHPVSYKQLFLTIEKHFEKSFLFVALPFPFLKAALFFTDRLPISLPVTMENLYGLKAMKAWHNKQDAEHLQVPDEMLEELLNKYFPR
jgi:nucleoside-diphosphate-sugar epimerase